MSLAGTTTTVYITFTPSYIDNDGYPAVVTYDFDVNFTSSCTVTAINFASVTSDQSYFVSQGLL